MEGKKKGFEQMDEAENEAEKKIIRKIVKELTKIAEAKPLKKKTFPSIGGVYHYIGENKSGHCRMPIVYSTSWTYEDIDFYRLDSNNCFEVKEEAEAEIVKRRALAIINGYIRENDLRLTESQSNDTTTLKYYIFWDRDLRGFYSGQSVIFQQGRLIDNLKGEKEVDMVINNCLDNLKIVFDVK